MKKVTSRLFLGLILALAIVFSLASYAFSEEGKAFNSLKITIIPSGGLSNSEAASGYIRNALYGKRRLLLGNSASLRLTQREKNFYDHLRKR